MNIQRRLSTKIWLLAVGNVLLLSLLFVVFMRFQLRQEFGMFLLEAGRDHTRAIGQDLSVDLERAGPEAWTRVLGEYSSRHGVTYSLFNVLGNQLAGPRQALPPEVRKRLRPSVNKENGVYWIPPFVQIADADVAYWLGVWLPVGQPVVADNQASRTILVLSSPTLVGNAYFFNPGPWIGLFAAAVGVTVLYWLPLIRGLTGSIRQMTEATAEIAEGHFETRLASARNDELGHLGVSIDQMAARLDAYTRAHKRFLSDVAHELRSPIARIQVAAAILGRNPEVGNSLNLRDLNEDADLLASLTDELLTFARAELLPTAGRLQPVRLAEVAERAVKMEGRNNIDIRVDIDPAIQVSAEPEYLFRSLANLVRNAVRYAGHSGEIVVAAKMEGALVALTVEDCGPGIPNEELGKIFTPFYRLEESRDRQSGGTGLGLAIVQSCITACQGSVECRNRVPAGLEVRITLNAA